VKEGMERWTAVWSIEPGSREWKSSVLSVQGWQICQWPLAVHNREWKKTFVWSNGLFLSALVSLWA